MRGLFFILLFVNFPAWADFAVGLEHFDQGRYHQAYQEWQADAQAGDSLAQLSLASLYEQGLGVETDLTKAAHWYEQAAMKGEMIAQRIIADWYERGIGVPRNPVRAYAWYCLMHSPDYPDQPDHPGRLAGAMSEDDISKAQGECLRLKGMIPSP